MGSLYSMTKKGSLAKSIVVCPDCNKPYTVYRTHRKGRNYKEGHVKDLWCFFCKAEKKFIQLSSHDAKYRF